MNKLLLGLTVFSLLILTEQVAQPNEYNIPSSLLSKAESGNPEALYRVAWDYYIEAAFDDVDVYSHLVTDEKAFALTMRNLQKAAKKGHIEANARLGDLYSHHYDMVKPDIRKAIFYYQQAADLGHVESMLSLGHIYYYTKNDFEKSFCLLLAVVNSKNLNNDIYKSAFFTLSHMYEKGKSGNEDLIKAYASKKIYNQLTAAVPSWENIKDISEKMTTDEIQLAEKYIEKWNSLRIFK